MWFQAKTTLPYYSDPDYRDTLVKSIKTALGDVPIDVTLFRDYGLIQVDTDNAGAVALSRLNLTEVKHAVDRGIISESSRTIL